jgi:hypothetical protein
MPKMVHYTEILAIAKSLLDSVEQSQTYKDGNADPLYFLRSIPSRWENIAVRTILTNVEVAVMHLKYLQRVSTQSLRFKVSNPL